MSHLESIYILISVTEFEMRTENVSEQDSVSCREQDNQAGREYEYRKIINSSVTALSSAVGLWEASCTQYGGHNTAI